MIKQTIFIDYVIKKLILISTRMLKRIERLFCSTVPCLKLTTNNVITIELSRFFSSLNG